MSVGICINRNSCRNKADLNKPFCKKELMKELGRICKICVSFSHQYIQYDKLVEKITTEDFSAILSNEKKFQRKIKKRAI